MRYIEVAASATDTVLGGADARIGNIIERLIITVNTANSAVSLKDGTGSSIPIMPASIAGGVGVYPVTLNMVSKKGAWKITTDSGVTVVAVGIFK